MGGRFGKYGDLKRKAAFRKSRKAALRKNWKEKGRLQKNSAQKDPIPKFPGRRNAEKDFTPK